MVDVSAAEHERHLEERNHILAILADGDVKRSLAGLTEDETKFDGGSHLCLKINARSCVQKSLNNVCATVERSIMQGSKPILENINFLSSIKLSFF